jgi:hypothetical protein
MAPNAYKRYIFQGSAVGVALRCKDFQNHPHCFAGSAALPPTGGCVESESGRHKVEIPGKGNILTYGNVTARVKGDFVNGEYGAVQIVAEASVSDLEILNRVHVQQLENRFVYDHSGNPNEPARFSLPKPPTLTLAVDNKPLRVEFERSLADALNRPFSAQEDEPIVTSIVQQLAFPNQEPIPGNRLDIRNFGTLFFGELVISGRNDRTLSLIRFELDEYGGSGTGGSTRPGPGQTT